MIRLRHLLDWSVEIIQFSMQEQHKDLKDINGEMLIRMEKTQGILNTTYTYKIIKNAL